MGSTGHLFPHVLRPRQKVLANDLAFVASKAAIAGLTNWNVIAATLMPDHVHLLIAPREREAAVGSASAAIKLFMRQDLKAPWHWQPGQFRSIAPIR
jgi:REP element-mobilizing transposase RayT